MLIARVEPLTTARALRGPFDYLLPDEMSEVAVGAVLRVPFGPQRIVGVVTGLAGGTEVPAQKLAEPLEVLEAETTAELVDIGLWVAREYCSTPARGLQLVLPPGTGTGGQRVRAKRQLVASLTPEGEEAIGPGTRLGKRQQTVLEALADGVRSSKQLAESAGADRATLRRLEELGLIETRSAGVRRSAGADSPDGEGAAVEAPTLTRDQQYAVDRITEAIEAEGPDSTEILLHGVTGSGKTEVYMAAVERVLALGRGAIVLVPEIGLTPQAVNRFRARLGDRVAVMHSAMPPGQRFDEWMRLHRGEATVCVGPRSAIFAPVVDLGLIVIDEEHDSSYKQEGDPSYDARAVASHRAASLGAVLVCGTATPRPETWVSTKRLELPTRVDSSRGLPPVEVVDMRGGDSHTGVLHTRTIEALEGVREAGSKAIVLINRRGFAPWLTCRSCGHHWGCPNCDVSLITHRNTGRLVCHHCAHAEPLPRVCVECGSVTLAQSGAGTQRVEQMLVERLDPMPIFRLDADTVISEGGHGAILDRFDEAESGVLIGTQMVAKGHDFPEVTLAVVIDADATLRFPDFRAEERTFAMVAQLAGRSGRGEAGGMVIVQTLVPGAPSIEMAARHDSEGFLAGEIERRRALDYPPFSNLIRIVLASEDLARLEASAAKLGAGIESSKPDSATVLGPAPMFRVRKRYRLRFLVKSHDREESVAAVGGTVEAMGAARDLQGVTISVDVDPQ